MKDTHRLFFILLALFTSMASSEALAYDFAEKNDDGVTIYYNWANRDNMELEVTFNDSYSNLITIKIPSRVGSNKQYIVTKIGDKAFYDEHHRNLCKKLTSITIPNSVTSIGDYAFKGCSNLTSITIPNSVTSIGEFAFDECTRLISVTIPNSVTSIGNGAFYGCTSLPVENNIRYADTYLVEVVDKKQSTYQIKEGTRFIGNGTFSNCTSLTSIDFPNSMTSIGEGAFYNCLKLTSIVLPRRVKNIGSQAFMGCIKLSDVTNLATSPQKISNVFHVYGTLHILPGCKSAYRNADGWKFFTIVEDAETNTIPINDEICQRDGYVNLENVSPNDYNTIRSKFRTVRIDLSNGRGKTNDNNVSVVLHNLNTGSTDRRDNRIQTMAKSAGRQIRDDSSEDKDITIVGTLVPESDDLYEYTFSSNMEVYGIDNLADKSMVWLKLSSSPNDDIIFFADEQVKSICVANWDTNGDGELSYDEAAAVTDIENKFRKKIFTSFDELKYFTGLTSIRDYAFSNCIDMTSITFSKSVTNIGSYAFYNCNCLISITIPDCVTSIGNNAFNGCTRLTSITIPSSVTSIGNSAFSNCSSLTSIIIPNSVTSIGEKAFQGCSSLNNVTVPVDDYSDFCNNTIIKLINLKINKPVILIGKNGKEINDYIVPNNVTSIGEYAFSNCSSLVSTTISNSVTSIGNSAFSNCSSLTSITIP